MGHLKVGTVAHDSYIDMKWDPTDPLIFSPSNINRTLNTKVRKIKLSYILGSSI